jgi:hypothetical protein
LETLATIPSLPPRMALLGLVGGSVLFVSFVLKVCDLYEDGSALAGLLTVPEAAWELSLGIYCAWKRFHPESPVAKPEMAIAHSEPSPRQIARSVGSTHPDEARNTGAASNVDASCRVRPQGATSWFDSVCDPRRH